MIIDAEFSSLQHAENVSMLQVMIEKSTPR